VKLKQLPAADDFAGLHFYKRTNSVDWRGWKTSKQFYQIAIIRL